MKRMKQNSQVKNLWLIYIALMMFGCQMNFQYHIVWTSFQFNSLGWGHQVTYIHFALSLHSNLWFDGNQPTLVSVHMQMSSMSDQVSSKIQLEMHVKEW